MCCLFGLWLNGLEENLMLVLTAVAFSSTVHRFDTVLMMMMIILTTL